MAFHLSQLTISGKELHQTCYIIILKKARSASNVTLPRTQLKSIFLLPADRGGTVVFNLSSKVSVCEPFLWNILSHFLRICVKSFSQFSPRVTLPASPRVWALQLDSTRNERSSRTRLTAPVRDKKYYSLIFQLCPFPGLNATATFHVYFPAARIYISIHARRAISNLLRRFPWLDIHRRNFPTYPGET